MKATAELHDLGQSIWLDNITRELLDSGQLQRYIELAIGDGSSTADTASPGSPWLADTWRERFAEMLQRADPGDDCRGIFLGAEAERGRLLLRRHLGGCGPEFEAGRRSGVGRRHEARAEEAREGAATLAHIPEKWIPVFRKGYGPTQESLGGRQASLGSNANAM